jgi:hypothetical protein
MPPVGFQGAIAADVGCGRAWLPKLALHTVKMNLRLTDLLNKHFPRTVVYFLCA